MKENEEKKEKILREKMEYSDYGTCPVSLDQGSISVPQKKVKIKNTRIFCALDRQNLYQHIEKH